MTYSPDTACRSQPLCDYSLASRIRLRVLGIGDCRNQRQGTRFGEKKVNKLGAGMLGSVNVLQSSPT